MYSMFRASRKFETVSKVLKSTFSDDRSRFVFHERGMMKGRTPTALLREKFPHIQSSSYSSVCNSSEQPVGVNTDVPKSSSRREQLVCHMKAQGLGDPNFKATKLGTGERERFIAAVTVAGQQFKTYPRTFPSKVG